ncbi:M23 family metallopeptidase [Nocardioides sp. CFH 31398]|uniref:M23 family metallopeptidase n=1 Tax=Nocardioides sp. CFH 31398 TaxID=2919579 RepID=UPI001F05276D|nr:M23 family metallopeptidase [Nocardioides sp. CFH 31398]MCH1866308.1 M23 family metallopeptidase [Nocardioides sp. CFH 31398]
MGNHRADRRGPRRADSSATPPARQAGGKRRAERPAARRTGVVSALPSAPLLVGVTALAVSGAGAVTAGAVDSADVVANDLAQYAPANAASGKSGTASSDLLRSRQAAVSRDSARDALEDAAADKEVEQAEQQAEQRNAALQQFAQQAEEQADELALNRWVLPVTGYRLTNTFGLARSYYSSGYHTGLDFAAPTGTPIVAVANGTVTETGYDGAYGNKTVITLDDGTELWFCHQTSITVNTGDTVAAGDQIGTVGSTGNSTGPHLHLEVRPGAGDPVDPAEALAVHGVTV